MGSLSILDALWIWRPLPEGLVHLGYLIFQIPLTSGTTKWAARYLTNRPRKQPPSHRARVFGTAAPTRQVLYAISMPKVAPFSIKPRANHPAPPAYRLTTPIIAHRLSLTHYKYYTRLNPLQISVSALKTKSYLYRARNNASPSTRSNCRIVRYFSRPRATSVIRPSP